MPEGFYSTALLLCLAATLACGAAFALVYGMQRLYVLHRMAGLARQSRHLYRALQAEMQDIEALRLAQHDARNGQGNHRHQMQKLRRLRGHARGQICRRKSGDDSDD